jgi:putative FmdB family regulatory protein
MPTYEYECKKCRHEFSLTMAMDEHEKKKVRCPKCKGENVKHLIASVFVTTSRKS